MPPNSYILIVLCFTEEGDQENRLVFSHMILDEHDRDPTILDRILWTDEATYGRTGLLNAHNEHYWAHENPLLAREGNETNKIFIK